MIAAIAAVFAYRAYRKQAGQLEIAQKHDRSWQAAKVAAWIDTERTREANADLDDIRRIVFAVHNASDLPIREVRLHPDGGDPYEIGVLEPRRDPLIIQLPELTKPFWDDLEEGRERPAKSEMLNRISDSFELTFKDVEGQLWGRPHWHKKSLFRNRSGALQPYRYNTLLWSGELVPVPEEPHRRRSWRQARPGRRLFRWLSHKTLRP